MKAKRSPRSDEGRPYLARVTAIARDHILYAERYPDRLTAVADRLKITVDSALAYAIADQITEEFTLTENLE